MVELYAEVLSARSIYCALQLRLSGVNVDEEGTIHDPALLMEVSLFTLGTVTCYS
jgi:hypothetical protein